MKIACWMALAVSLSLVVGCSRGGERAERGESDRPQADSDELVSSDAARDRGVASDTAAGEKEGTPRIEVAGVVYEWRNQPTRGLHVTVDLVNPVDTYERARGHIFIIASSSADPAVKGVYPWNVGLDGDRPRKHEDGTRLLFRKDDQIRVFVPYEGSSGYYDLLTVLVYNLNGDVVINQTYELEVTGEPTGPMKPGASLVL